MSCVNECLVMDAMDFDVDSDTKPGLIIVHALSRRKMCKDITHSIGGGPNMNGHINCRVLHSFLLPFLHGDGLKCTKEASWYTASLAWTPTEGGGFRPTGVTGCKQLLRIVSFTISTERLG